MKYFEYMIFVFNGMAFAFFLSFFLEALNPEPHEGALLFNSFAIGVSAYLSLILVHFVSRKGK
ncbi:hypothetical protein [Leptospira santarosai]|uniref:Uncharacterized protein n=1 Tax=Leptospira santarosai str. ZUN179 TaxID=1049985 RepID=M6UNY8_9LEPT|nr:hypothetical protein [Leptospira santarosai]EMO46852.1 hypothetical protein LEP1GSC187_2206 [Leptospira santarosai str. ZUN179]